MNADGIVAVAPGGTPAASYLPRRSADPAIGDLHEDYLVRLARTGRVRAALWLMRESSSLVSAYRQPVGRERPVQISIRLGADLRSTARMLGARAGSTAAIVLVLGLGIGLVSVIFAIADPFVLRPLPYPRAQALAEIFVSTQAPRTPPTLADWRARHDLFRDVAAVDSKTVVVQLDGPEPFHLQAVPRGYFALLGVPAPIPEDWDSATASADVPLVLTDAARRKFFSNQAAIGTRLPQVDASGAPALRVVGVLPRAFRDPFARDDEFLQGYIPRADRPFSLGTQILARLAPGVRPREVSVALSSARNGQVSSEKTAGRLAVTATDLRTWLTAFDRPQALGALLAGMLVLLVCAANVGNLLLIRTAVRRRELATREALGASRLDIARLMFIEIIMLAAAGVGAGLMFARVALALLTQVLPDRYARFGTPAITPRVVVFAFVAGAVVMLAGLVPLWAASHATRASLLDRTSTGETRVFRVLRFVLTMSQTALAAVLVVGAGLLGRSLANLAIQDPGYAADTFAVNVVYADPSAARTDIAVTLDRLRHLPGVLIAGAVPDALVDGMTHSIHGTLVIDGRAISTSILETSSEFFSAMRARVIAGRLPSDAEPNGVVVNRSFVDRYEAGVSPIGRVVELSSRSFPVVGVVDDLRTRTLDNAADPTAYFPLGGTQVPLTMGWVNYAIRARSLDAPFVSAIAHEIQNAAPGAIIRESDTMRTRLVRSVNMRLFAALIVALFSITAIGVSAAGITGAVGFAAARRTREIAIRVAVGANAHDVRRLVTRDALGAAVTGVTIGFMAGAWLSRFLKSLLYGVTPDDPMSLACAGAVIVAVVVCAAWIPARRALRVSPTIALRAE